MELICDKMKGEGRPRANAESPLTINPVIGGHAAMALRKVYQFAFDLLSPRRVVICPHCAARLVDDGSPCSREEFEVQERAIARTWDTYKAGYAAGKRAHQECA